MATSKKGPEKKVGISYWSKDKVKCPVCKKDFEREVMRSGNGRMIAGGLTEELHRIFEPSAKSTEPSSRTTTFSNNASRLIAA